MSALIRYDPVTLHPITLTGCGHLIYMTEHHVRNTEHAELPFYCTVCGKSQKWGATALDKARSELEQMKRSRDWHQNNAAAERLAREKTERRLSATRGAKTRIVNRIKNGVCPCCNRTFINLHQHMKNQHPDYHADSPDTIGAE